MKPTNEALRAWAAETIDHALDCTTPKCPAAVVKVSVPEWGVVHLTDRAAFIEATIEVPLNEDGSIA